MSALKTDKYRYMIVYMLDDLDVGEHFKPTALHISILPWFALETDEAPFVDWFYKHFDAVEAFEAVADKQAMFGPRQDVPVSIVEPQKKFLALHKTALSWFGAVGARWAENDPYVGDDFIPHIAQRDGYILDDSKMVHINSLTLFKANRHEDQIRTVVAKAIFHEN